MSALLFTGAPGRVIALDDPTVQGVMPALVDVESGALSFQQRKSLITRITIQHETNHQFLHTLGGDIFIYVFGDRIGPMTISGLMTAWNCDQPGDLEHGVEKMLKWYNLNKLSVRPTPVSVMLGQTPVKGFLAGFQADVFDHKLSLLQYNLNLFVPPDKD